MTDEQLEQISKSGQDIGKAVALAEMNDWLKAQPEYVSKETLLDYMIEKVKELV